MCRCTCLCIWKCQHRKLCLLTVRVLAVPAQSVHCLLEQPLSIGLEAGVVLSAREKTTDGGETTSLGEMEGGNSGVRMKEKGGGRE